VARRPKVPRDNILQAVTAVVSSDDNSHTVYRGS
jgi:hypothetical protein